MAKFRNEMTNDEKLAVAALGTDSNFNMVNMRENSIDALVEKEKAAKMNEQLERFQEQMDKSQEEMKKSQDTIEYDKTDFIYQLVGRGSIYFLNRPHRFGKSIMKGGER